MHCASRSDGQTASREEILAHVAPVVSPRTIGNRLLAAGLSSHVPLASVPLASQHRQAWILWCHERLDRRVELRSVIFSDGSRFSLYARDRCTHIQHWPGECHLPECICPHAGPTSGFMVWGAISYNSRSHLVFLQGKVNSAYYIAQIVNPVLLPFLWQEGDVLFSAGQCTSTYGYCDAKCSSWYTTTSLAIKISKSRVSWACMEHDEAGTSLSLSLPQPLPNWEKGCKILGTVYHRMIFITFMTICMWK